MDVGTVRAAFDLDPESRNVAYTAADGVLRVWEIETSLLKNEFLPSAHLSATCTCMKWRPTKSTTTSHQQKKKKGKNVDHVVDDSPVVAFGTATGSVYLYSPAKGEIQSQLEAAHASPVADVCWSTDCTSLYSGHTDGLVVHWDTIEAKQIRKWRCSKSSLSRISLCGETHLISASRSLSLWSLDTLSSEMTFTGHATDVVSIHSISTDAESTDLSSVYVISVATDDRVISLWSAGGKVKKSKRAKASFILENEPLVSSISYEQALASLKMAVLTTAASIELIQYQLNSSSSKKPVRPFCHVRVFSPSNHTLPVLMCSLTDELLVMYGTPVCPAFDSINLMSLQEAEVKLTRQDPSQSTAVTRVTSVGNVRKPKTDGAVTTLTPAVEGGRKLGSKKMRGQNGKRSLDEPEATIEERLAMLRDASGGDKSKDLTGPVESQASLLSQGLQSDDMKILAKVLRMSDPKAINTTIRRLPLTCVMPLMKHLTLRLEKHGSASDGGGVVVHTSLIKWVRALLHIHASYLATFPELMERLQRMYSIMEHRVTQLATFTKLQGRLELVLSQIARQKDDEGMETASALLTLQDESSEDEMMDDLDMMLAPSESEDGYLSAEEDDLVK